MSKSLKGTIAIILVSLIGVVDYLLGYEIAFSLFYVIPIILSSWYMGDKFSFFLSILSGACWLIVDIAAGHIYSKLWISFWNSFIRIFFFFIITYTISKMRELLNREKELARFDFVTNIPNTRNYYDYLEIEMKRFMRFHRPFTIV